jgi:signal transduction histidine kinase
MVAMLPTSSTGPSTPAERVLLTVLAVSGLVLVFSATLLLELDSGVLAALVGSTVLVALYATAAGRLAGLVLALVALVLGVIADARSDASLGSAVIVVYGMTVVCLALLVETLTRERVQTAAELERLHTAVGALTIEPELDPTLDSVVSSARVTAHAVATAVFLLDGPVVTAPAIPEELRTEEVAAIGRRMLASPSSPLGRAVHDGSLVVIGDGDPQFPVWTREFADFVVGAGVRSIVVVPLVRTERPLGVLVAAFAAPDPGPSVTWLLAAYAQEATLAIARSQAYERERRAAEVLAETDRVKSEFLGMVSHELRTPLTAVKGFVDTVLLQWERLDDATKRDLLERVSANTDELTTLITRLLDFTRIEGDVPPLTIEPLDLAATLRRIVDELRPVLASRPVTVEVPPGLHVLGDLDAITHVVGNLLSNAAKYTPDGTPVRVQAREAAEEVVVSVEDDGPGIAAHDQQRIFERFYQAPGHGSSRRGAGLGLSIAARYVELLGGRIWVDSEPGRGAAFHVAIPRASVPPAAESARPGSGLTT